MASQGDRLFARELRTLPTALREAVVEAELDEPSVLQNLRSLGKDKLGLSVGGKRAHMVSEHGFASPAEHAMHRSFDGVSFVSVRWWVCLNTLGG